MLRELVHFARTAPSAARLRRRTGRAALLDHVENALDLAGKARWRSVLVADLQGEVLEIGAGSGAMFRHYPSAVHVTAVEPDEGLLALAAERAKQAKARIDLRAGVGEELPFRDAAFDAVVCVSVLCCVSSVVKTLREVSRVLRPHGALRLIEHVKSDRPIAGALQQAFNPLWRALNGQGCNMNRDPKPVLRELGFEIVAVDSFQVFAREMPAAFVNEVIRAVRAPAGPVSTA
jgi:ubiquinone/menaquinone biosynthesis C-methylase UbiE